MEVTSEKDRLMQLRRRVEEEEANLTVNHISLCTDILGRACKIWYQFRRNWRR